MLTVHTSSRVHDLKRTTVDQLDQEVVFGLRGTRMVCLVWPIYKETIADAGLVNL